MYVTDFGNCGENDFIVYEMIYYNTLKKKTLISNIWNVICVILYIKKIIIDRCTSIFFICDLLQIFKCSVMIKRTILNWCSKI